jgi:hypothetical protein
MPTRIYFVWLQLRRYDCRLPSPPSVGKTEGSSVLLDEYWSFRLKRRATSPPPALAAHSPKKALASCSLNPARRLAFGRNEQAVEDRNGNIYSRGR